MISRSRSGPTADAISIECTTSAKSTVTCLYSAGFPAEATAAPHSLQNLAVDDNSVPQAVHATGRMVSSLASLRWQNAQPPATSAPYSSSRHLCDMVY